VYGAYLGVDLGRQLNVPGESFLDTKTSAMNRHKNFPDPFTPQCFKADQI
jgi:hypothetical protein